MSDKPECFDDGNMALLQHLKNVGVFVKVSTRTYFSMNVEVWASTSLLGQIGG